MRVLILATDFKPNPGGIAEMAWQIACELVARGNLVSVVASTTTRLSESDDQVPGLDVHRVFPPYPPGGRRSIAGVIRGWKWIRTCRLAVERLLSRTQPDVVLGTNYSKFFPSLLRSTSTPLFLVFHGGDLRSLLRSRVPGRRRNAKNMVHRSSWAFCNSHYTSHLLDRLVGEELDTKTVTGCGVRPQDYEDRTTRTDALAELRLSDCPTLISVCRLVRHKGIDMSLRALPYIRREVPGCRYMIVGDGPDRPRLETLSRTLGVVDAVDFRGHVDERTKALVYAVGDVFVMPSREGLRGEVEGFGISFLEANAHRIPVVAGRTGGIPDAVSDGVNGILVDPLDPGAVANATIELLTNPALCGRLAEGGRRRIIEQFNWPAIVEQIERRMKESTKVENTSCAGRSGAGTSQSDNRP